MPCNLNSLGFSVHSIYTYIRFQIAENTREILMALEHHVRQMEGTKQYVAEIKNMSQELLEVTEKIANDFFLH